VVHFEIHSDDPERAKKFYINVLKWNIKKWEGPEDYWLVTTGPDNHPGINGGLMRRQGSPGDGISAYVCTINVPSVDEYISRIKENGGLIVADKMAIPGIGWQAYCKDTEGNMFGINQEDKTAK
jgi:predicted enzyme related to lactoylglutathione lyase